MRRGGGEAQSTIILMRHGESEWNRSGRLAGQRDVDLTDRGREQASSVRTTVARLAPGIVLCSPLKRARETAALIGYSTPLIEDALRENDVGEWTGRATAELIERHGAIYHRWRRGEASPPGGESWGDFSDRVEAAIRPHVAYGETLLVVAHGGVVRAAVSRLLETPPHRLSPVAPASLTVVTGFLTPEGESPLRLAAYNWTPSPFRANG